MLSQNREGAWVFNMRVTFEEAVEASEAACGDYNMDCRLFAVGNRIVYDMSEAERQEAAAKMWREIREGEDLEPEWVNAPRWSQMMEVIALIQSVPDRHLMGLSKKQKKKPKNH